MNLDVWVFLQIEELDTNGRKGNPFLLSPVLVPTRTGILDDPVLGRESFMEPFEITIRQKQREFVLREISSGIHRRPPVS